MNKVVKFSTIPDIVSDLIQYDPETGFLTWNHIPRNFFNSERGYKSVNTKKEGKRAELEHIKDYFQIFIMGKLYMAHRVAWKIHTGHCDEKLTIDHVNGKKDDNRICNLRQADFSEQMKNIGRAKNNTSGFTGVTWDKSRSKWVALIKISGKNIHLGRFISLEDAISARKIANIKYGFHINHGKIR